MRLELYVAMTITTQTQKQAIKTRPDPLSGMYGNPVEHHEMIKTHGDGIPYKASFRPLSAKPAGHLTGIVMRNFLNIFVINQNTILKMKKNNCVFFMQRRDANADMFTVIMIKPTTYIRRNQSHICFRWLVIGTKSFDGKKLLSRAGCIKLLFTAAYGKPLGVTMKAILNLFCTYNTKGCHFVICV